MKSIKYFLVLIMSVMMASCSSTDTITGSGNLINENREVNSFSAVSSEGVFEVTLTQGAQQSVEIFADDNIMDKVKTKVINDKLYLELEGNDYRGITIQATIVTPRLNSLSNSGVGDMFIYNISNDGTFSIINSGTADIIVEGLAKTLEVSNEGTGDIIGFDFIVEDCQAEIQGSGNIEISVSNSLDVEIEGSGYVYYKGTPTINTAITGSGKVVSAN